MTAMATIHLENSTDYGVSGVEAYAKLGHGSDMHHFLRPFIAEKLEQLEGKSLLDAGCGACPYAIYAALHGARVYAIDIQEGMISEAQTAIKAAQLSKTIIAQVGDVTQMEFVDAFFDHTISINVGCNLPSSVFDAHFKEIERTLQSNGSATVAAPYSLGVVFTNGQETKPVEEHIREILENLPDNPSPNTIRNQLNELTEVTSATFTLQDSRLILVTPETILTNGQQIWRKLTHVTIPNYFHSNEDYLTAFEKANLKVDKCSSAHFSSSFEREVFNLSEGIHPRLGPAYEKNAPFIVYSVSRKVPRKD